MKRLYFSFFAFVFASAVTVKAWSQEGCDAQIQNTDQLKDYNYVIVPGIFNEFLLSYMTEYRRQLLDLGVPREQIVRVNIPTYRKPETNGVYIEKALKKLDPQKEIIFFAHSKGALELLYFLKDRSNSVHVKRAFLIQGALDGSSSYRMVMEDKNKNGILKIARSISNYGYIKSFRESFSHSFVRKRLEGLSEDRDLISKITFIESDVKFSELPLKFRLLGWFYDMEFKASGDGVLLREDHVPHELKGQKICALFKPADHGKYVKAAPWDQAAVKRSRDFVSDLLFGFKRDQ